MCGQGNISDIQLQAQAIEALIHAVEDERLPLKRVEDALARNIRAKERFLREWRPKSAGQLKSVIGCDAHRAVADDMAAFA